MRVLVVEDDPDARALIARILADAGAQVSDAPNAEAAMAHIKTAVPDVLVSDIGMAQLDGYQLLRNLRAGGFDAERLPAIALTAFSRVQDRADALAAGFQAHLAKPVRAEALIGAVANFLRRKSRHDPDYRAPERAGFPDGDDDQHHRGRGAQRQRRHEHRHRRQQHQQSEPHQVRQRVVLRAGALEEHIARRDTAPDRLTR